jgi:hypothetical protein
MIEKDAVPVFKDFRTLNNAGEEANRSSRLTSSHRLQFDSFPATCIKWGGRFLMRLAKRD